MLKHLVIACMLLAGSALPAPAGAELSWPPRQWRIGEITLTQAQSRHRFEQVRIDTMADARQLTIARVTNGARNGSAWHAPLRLDAREQPGAPQILLTLRQGDALRLNFEIDRARNRLSLAPVTIDFTRDGLQPAILLPPLAGLLSDATGRIRIRAHAGLEPPFRGRLEFTIDGLSTQPPGIAIEALDAEIALDQLWPPSGERLQTLRVEAMDLGKITADAALTFMLEQGGLEFVQARIDTGTSQLELAETRFDLLARSGGGRLLVNGLDLASVTDHVELDGLSATGWLGGEMPFTLDRNGVVTIRAGQLAAATPGVIRYRPQSPPAALAGDDPNISLTRQALENFHFSGLKINVDGRSDGDTRIALELAGANPDLYGGYPLEFNLNLDGALGILAQRAVGAYQLPDRLARKLLDLLAP